MNNENTPLHSKKTLLLILLPMIVTALSLRLYLHLFGINHLYVAGYVVRHLFSGALLVIVAGFVLAFEPSRRWLAVSSRVALGIGSALVLDEIVFLIATEATKEDYVSRISWEGSAIFVSLATILLIVIYKLNRDKM